MGGRIAEREPAFGSSDYVVRYGLRGLLGTSAALGGWIALGGAALIARSKPPGVVTDLIFAAGLIGIGIAWVGAWRRVRAREVVFAVHSGGVYFGPDPVSTADIGWDKIIAVEFFTERRPASKTTTTYRCVGVRGAGTRQPHRPGSRQAAQPLPARAEQYMLAAGRPDLIPGHDGTIRLAYRRMSGWRADREALAAAVARFAPAIPVVNGPAWPPVLTRADAFAARRARRS